MVNGRSVKVRRWLNGYLETWTLGTLGADKKSGIRVWKIRTLTVSCTIDTNV